ncbi:MAG: EAL domain-containing protein [Clostridia bacterium]|nr:EAL domain-containing protein [Clostridia bacterium]
MYRKRGLLTRIVFLLILSVFFLFALLAITNEVFKTVTSSAIEDNTYDAERALEFIQNEAKINISMLDELNNGNESTITKLNQLIEKKIEECKRLDILSEEIVNIALFDLRTSSGPTLSYRFTNDSEFDELELFLNTEGTEAKDCFINKIEILEEGEHKATLALYTKKDNYITEMERYKNIVTILSYVYFAIIVYLFCVNIYRWTRKQRIDLPTGLISKSNYKAEMKSIIQKQPKERGIFVVIGFRDLYDFEEPNMEIIEEIVIKFANYLKRFRSAKSVVARVSERKLGLYIHDYKETDLVDKILKEVEKLLRSKRSYQNIQYYMGIAYYPDHEQTVEGLVNGAIYALETLRKGKKQYHIKNFQVYDPKNRKEYVDKQYLYDEVEKIISERRVYSVFQPIVSLENGEIVGYEALSRPISELIPNVGMLIQLANEMKIIEDLEILLIYFINKTVFESKESFQDKWLFINTNVSIKYGDSELSRFRNTIDKITHKLVVELTEYDEIDFDIISDRISKLREFGAMIAIDDFGSGYSNELALLSLKPDIVKIDMGLIRNIDKDSRKFQIVENLTKYALNNGVKTLAEGVETPEELKIVKDLHIDYVQGFIFARPEKNPINKVFDVQGYIDQTNM